nr:LxmA leader domain family RiPP [Rhodococcus sp. (in: high G+C Gram-positive bacteria)]
MKGTLLMANARDLIANYSTYTSALEINHSAAADTTARTSPACISAASAISAVSIDNTFDHSC